MDQYYTKPRGYGAMTPRKVSEIIAKVSTEIEPGIWIPARPLPYKSFIERLKQAWDVLRYRADALYWRE